MAAERLAYEKAKTFATQYATPRAESEAKAKRNQSSKQIKILSRLDSGYETDYWRWNSSGGRRSSRRIAPVARLTSPVSRDTPGELSTRTQYPHSGLLQSAFDSS